jgi:hypothetical protein
MTLRLNGSTSGYSEIDAPATAGNNTIVLPSSNGTADQVLSGNGSGALSWVDRGRMVLETPKASTSGTNVDFTGIPSWTKRVTVMLDGVSTNGASVVLIQLGTSGGIDASAYYGMTSFITSVPTSGLAASTTGVNTAISSATAIRAGSISFTRFSSSDAWVFSGILVDTANSVLIQTAGIKGLSGSLDRVRVTTANGTDAFDSGTINIVYEG